MVYLSSLRDSQSLCCSARREGLNLGLIPFGDIMFDRIEVCEAYYVFASLYHSGQSSREYAIFGRLNRIQFDPSIMLSRYTLGADGRDCLARLLRRYRANGRKY